MNAAVEEVIRKLVTNTKFEQAIRKKIGSRIDTEELKKFAYYLCDRKK